jgi:hypothetical protein
MNALKAVFAITMLCIFGVIVLALVGRPIPDALTVTTGAGVGFLVGSTATALGRK